jgi:hypothetical protein
MVAGVKATSSIDAYHVSSSPSPVAPNCSSYVRSCCLACSDVDAKYLNVASVVE